MQAKTIEKAVELLKEKNQGKTIKLKIKGKCMHPLIKEGSTIEVKTIKPEKIETGDIIVYLNKTKLFAHRFIGKKNGKLLVKGDKNKEFDFLVNEKTVLGKVTKINGKKTDSLEFNLAKIPLTAVSYLNGRIFKAMEKIK